MPLGVIVFTFILIKSWKPKTHFNGIFAFRYRLTLLKLSFLPCSELKLCAQTQELYISSLLMLTVYKNALQK